MGGQAEEAPVASSTTMEAAEQLIQLSGISGSGGESSGSRSADSVKAAGEERREGVPAAAVESSSAGKRREKGGGGGEDDERAVMGGVRRRRPRFRSLAAIYRETERIELAPGHEEAEEDGSGTENKQAAGGAAHGEAIAPAAPSKGRRVVRRRSSTVGES